jgi:hypothetical protein
MKKLVLIICGFIIGIGARAQFTDSARHFVGYSGTGIINNTETTHSYVFRNIVQAGFNYGTTSGNASFGWVYGKLNKLRSNNDYESAVDLDYRIDSSKFKVWVLGTYDKSLSLKINKRVQAGSGLSYDIFKKNNSRLNISDGILYESSDLLLPGDVNDVYHTWRNSLRVKYTFHIKQLVQLSGIHFLQNSLSDGNDYNIRSQSALSVKIFSFVSFTTAVTYNKINRLDRENFLLTVGLAMQKYF